MILTRGADSQQVYHGRDGESVFLRCSGAERMYMRSGEGMAVIFPSVIIAGMTEFVPDKGERRFGVKTVSIQNGQNLRWGRS